MWQRDPNGPGRRPDTAQRGHAGGLLGAQRRRGHDADGFSGRSSRTAGVLKNGRHPSRVGTWRWSEKRG